MRIGLAYINPVHVAWVGPVLESRAADTDTPFYFRVEIVSGTTFKFDFGSKEFANANRNNLIKEVEG